MTTICPVCEHEITVGEAGTCPVCDTDLSLLAAYQRKAAVSGNRKLGFGTFICRFWWLLLVLFLLPILFFSIMKPFSREVISQITVVITNTPVNTQVITQPELTPTHKHTLQTTPTPTQTATVMPTSTWTSEPPRAQALGNINCRSGPGAAFPVVGFFVKGSQAQVLAIVVGGSWIMIPHPQVPDRACWVWAQAVDVTGAAESVPQIPSSQLGD